MTVNKGVDRKMRISRSKLPQLLRHACETSTSLGTWMQNVARSLSEVVGTTDAGFALGTYTSQGGLELSPSSPAPGAFALLLHPAPQLTATVWFPFVADEGIGRAERLALGRLGMQLEAAIRLRVHPGAVRMIFDPDASSLRHTDPRSSIDESEGSSEAALVTLWSALMGGRYSLVERRESGRRYYLLLENAVTARAQRRLSATEVAVVRGAATGMSGKAIAYSAGISAAAVSMALSSAAAKLGLASATDLARVVRSLIEPPTRVDDTVLTAAEREVLALVLAGKTNREIGRARGRSERTIANQVASILRKTGMVSRRTLRVRR